ncbi:cysteine dioxygenase [Mangrovactinospora gilvigrisea]|uniref:Cysteine dioxygenase n=1 Tax=Mangrovactinospora gilvigrisea TaxID=1428644 RepID=A0A1J7CG53_9ACTN|nr:cysteine dioxygenase [Mangrovactinospora gilvigrisea]
MGSPAFPDGLCDISIAGDPLALPHREVARPEHPATVGDFAALVRRLAAQPGRWAHLVRYDALSRGYARLATGPGYEVWLLCWLPGQGTGRHGHGRSSGVFTVVSGELTERRRGGAALRPGTLRVSAPGTPHEVVNASLEPAVSIHAYFPGLTEMPRMQDSDADEHRGAALSVAD